ncbi:MAG: DUF4861 family protein [Cyclobacteriaceae bacterium]
MKYILFSILFCSMFGCSEPLSIVLTNSSSTDLDNQPVILRRSSFDLQQDDYLIFSTTDNPSIPTQFDDMDGDGIWDEVAMILDFDASSSVELMYEVVPKDGLPEFEQKTAIHFGYSPNKDGNFTPVTENVRPLDHVAQSKPYIYQFEGPGWENELIVYRSYFDSRNGKDIFTKTSPGLMAPQIGLGENYHEIQDWGMDVLKVGNSLGAGALAMLKNDSIYRLTDTKKATFKLVSQGPVRAIMQLIYEDWKVEDETFDLTETLSIWAGKRHYESEVALSGTGADTLVTGIVDLFALEAAYTKGNGAEMIYTHGLQSENKDILGMGLIVPTDGFIAFDKAPEEGEGVVNTYTAYLKPIDGLYRFAFYTGWELDDEGFKDEAYFKEQLTSITSSMTNPIKITE